MLLGVFTNPGYDATVSLAQVFWLRTGDAGQPDRFYVTADRPLSVTGDFADFGSDMSALRRRLRAAPGVRVHDGFPDYGKDFRRRLGIESEQAMELFHQTVSMKSVGNLTDFVRDHMLEPFDAAKRRRRHRRPLRGPDQGPRGGAARQGAAGALLTPLLKDCDAARQGPGRDGDARRAAGGAGLLLRRPEGRADQAELTASTERDRH